MSPTSITPPPMLCVTFNDTTTGPFAAEASAAEVAGTLSMDGYEALQHSSDQSRSVLWVDGEVVLEGSTTSIMKELGRA